MTYTDEVPSETAIRESAEVFEKARRIASQSQARAIQLENAVKELEREHHDALAELRNAYESENATLRQRLHAEEKLNDHLEQRIHALETNSALDIQAREHVATIIGLLADATDKARRDFGASVVDAMTRERESIHDTSFEPVTTQDRQPVTVRKLTPADRANFFKKLEADLTAPLQPQDETAGDDGQPAPAFLTMRPER